MKNFNLGVLVGILFCITCLLSINPEAYSPITFALTGNQEIAQTVENLVSVTYNTTWYTIRWIAIIILLLGFIVPYFFTLGRNANKNIKDL